MAAPRLSSTPVYRPRTTRDDDRQASPVGDKTLFVMYDVATQHGDGLSERFLSQYRMKSGKDFQRAYDRRQRAGDDVLLVFGCENDLPHPRLGLSVSRKVGPAVFRNRWKRLVREAFRLCRPRLPVGVDLVVIPRREIKPELSAIQSSLESLAQRVVRKLRRTA